MLDSWLSSMAFLEYHTLRDTNDMEEPHLRVRGSCAHLFSWRWAGHVASVSLSVREGTQTLSRVMGGYREMWNGRHLIQLSPAHSGVAKAVVEGPLQMRECGWEPPQLTLTLTLLSPALALQLRGRRPRHAYWAKAGERTTLKPTGVVRSDNPWATRWI